VSGDGAAGLPHEAYLAALSALEHVGPATLRRLLALGTPAEVWDRVVRGSVPASVLEGHPRRGDGLPARWAAQTSACDPGRMWDHCRRLGIGVTSLGAHGYPAALAGDPEPPVVLFHRGDPDVLGAVRVAVVGTRRATGYGRRVAHELGRDLARVGVCVLSGLALGIDAAAHAGALDARTAPAGGRDPDPTAQSADGRRRPGEAAGPAAVVGAGLDAPCPARNAALARSLTRVGVVLSEVPPGVGALPWRFPVRNRILAGLADAVVVVESAGAGGSMSTVQHAQVRDRPVLAVPGPVDSAASEGTNALLAEGAAVCTGVDDVLCALGLVGRSVGGPRPADPRPPPVGGAAAVLDHLGWRPETPERLVALTGMGVAGVAVALGSLEDDGWVVRRGGFVERVARPTIRGSGSGRQ
jgi:DNA processing protein